MFIETLKIPAEIFCLVNAGEFDVAKKIEGLSNDKICVMKKVFTG
jgi:hypothetical protein